MPILNFEGQTYCGDATETVLDILLEAGETVNYSCKKGNCQICLLHCKQGKLPDRAQTGLRYALKQQGYFLSCQCPLIQDLKVSIPEEPFLIRTGIVEEKSYLGEEVCRFVLRSEQDIGFLPGQFVNLRCCKGVMRSYAIANAPNTDNLLELHILRYEGGELSSWIFDKCAEGSRIEFHGPYGGCYYIPEKQDQNLLLIGNNIGLAPLIGIAKAALEMGHKGKIALYHGASRFRELYLHEELCEMEKDFPSFFYFPCLTTMDLLDRARQGAADEVAFRDFRDLANWRIFVTGNPDMVARSKIRAFASGAKMEDIYEEPFNLKDLRRVPRVKTV